jgi:hypothetical protein
MTYITSAPSTYVSLMIIPPYAPACLMLNTPLVASTASHSASQLSVLPTQVYELTETVVKCCRSYMRCARFLRRYTIER